VHKAIRWNKKDPMLEPDIDFLPWQIIVKNNNNKNSINVVSQSNKEYVAAKGSTSVKVNPLKRHIEEVESDDFDILPALKKLQKNTPQEVGTSEIILLRHPKCFIWSNNSCAFDAVLSNFHEIWESDHTLWEGVFRELHTHFMDMLILGFEKLSCGQETLEAAREQLHQELARSEGAQFRFGRYVRVDAVLEKLLQTENAIQSSQVGYPHNHETSHRQHRTVNHCMLQSLQSSGYHSISSWTGGKPPGPPGTHL
jgi:hypothetical protein